MNDCLALVVLRLFFLIQHILPPNAGQHPPRIQGDSLSSGRMKANVTRGPVHAAIRLRPEPYCLIEVVLEQGSLGNCPAFPHRRLKPHTPHRLDIFFCNPVAQRLGRHDMFDSTVGGEHDA